MPFQIVRNDITAMKVDAIVNTANPEAVYARGTDSAVYRAAGSEKLLAARRELGSIAVGEAGITPAFALDAKYVIHTIGPIWQGGTHGESDQMRHCYENSLHLALKHGCESIAFPLISTGTYGFPKGEALQIALSAIREFLSKEEMTVYLTVFDRETFELSGKLFADINSYIDEHYVSDKLAEEYDAAPGTSIPLPSYGSEPLPMAALPPVPATPATESVQDKTFQTAKLSEEAQTTVPPAVIPKATKPLAEAHATTPEGVKPSAEVQSIIPTTAKQPAAARTAIRQPKPTKQPAIAPFTALPSAKRKNAAPQTFTQEEKLPSRCIPKFLRSKPKASMPERSIDNVIAELGETFQQRLLRLIDERELTDVEVYKRANLDRKLFSKIRCNAKDRKSVV